MQLSIIDFPYKNAQLNLAFEEFLLTEIEKDIETVYLVFYENQSSVILGKTLDLEQEVYQYKAPLVTRRLSGGGSVYHGPGNINFGVFLSLETFSSLFAIHESYRFILGAIVSGFENLDLSIQGLSDLAIRQGDSYRKISGNSQVRKKKWIFSPLIVLV